MTQQRHFHISVTQIFCRPLPNLTLLTVINSLAGIKIWRVHASQFFPFWLVFNCFGCQIASLFIWISWILILYNLLLEPFLLVSSISGALNKPPPPKSWFLVIMPTAWQDIFHAVLSLIKKPYFDPRKHNCNALTF